MPLRRGPRAWSRTAARSADFFDPLLRDAPAPLAPAALRHSPLAVLGKRLSGDARRKANLP
ncbi:hypothetical protein [Streptomyces microflavus]|uniref:hypothetical protein n=1 Tax=Streptomyces microflavus TaxID=1919 RepID=UPI0033B580C3